MESNVRFRVLLWNARISMASTTVACCPTLTFALRTAAHLSPSGR
jgi:hypothetical protein